MEDGYIHVSISYNSTVIKLMLSCSSPVSVHVMY